MRVALIAIVALLIACVPTFEPAAGSPGATLTATAHEAGTLYRVDLDAPADRVYLYFVGDDLAVNARECTARPDEVWCVVEDVRVFYQLVVAGVVRNTAEYGVVCRAGECRGLNLTP